MGISAGVGVTWLVTVAIISQMDANDRPPAPHLWRSCCTLIDPRVLQFLVQTAIALLVIAFCMYQLVHKAACSDQQLYMSTMMFVIGVFLPNPKPQ